MNAPSHEGNRRGRFQGVRQVLRFNWVQYAGAAAVLVTVWLMLNERLMRGSLAGLLVAAACVVLWWSIVSIVASYWVYDWSGLILWEWLKNELPEPPSAWLNVHSGLDESTAALRRMWPKAEGDTVDIFASAEMTEGSIHRARGGQAEHARRVDFRALPFSDGQFDGVFLFFAAHELRRAEARQALYREVRRVLANAGQVVMVEHLRDAPNFLAYGPGFLHFHSQKTWRTDLDAAGLRVKRELHFTPFVRVFILEKVS